MIEICIPETGETLMLTHDFYIVSDNEKEIRTLTDIKVADINKSGYCHSIKFVDNSYWHSGALEEMAKHLNKLDKNNEKSI